MKLKESLYASSIRKLINKLPNELPNDLRLSILGKLQNFMSIEPSIQSPQKKYILGTGAQTVRKNRYQSFSVFSKFALFLNFSQSILQ